MSEEIKTLSEEIKTLKKRIDALEKIENEARQDLIDQAKKVSDYPDGIIEKMSRCDLKQIIAKNTKPAEEIPAGEPRKDEKPINPFAKPEDWC